MLQFLRADAELGSSRRCLETVALASLPVWLSIIDVQRGINRREK